MNYADAGYIYAIRNTVNGGMYIGSTVQPKARWQTHRGSLKRGNHHSFILQRAWNKYGEAAFEFKILAVCPKSMRIEYENLLMPLQKYNVLRTAKERLVRGGWSHSDEFKLKMSVTHKGKPLTEEHRQKLAIAAKNRVYGDGFRKKARDRQLGVSPSPATRTRLSESVKKAKAASVLKTTEVCQRIYELARLGGKIGALCAEHKISNSTFYDYCKKLSLPTFKQQRGGGK